MSLWRAALGHVVSAYRPYMIRGVFGVVKGGFSSGFATPPSFPRRRESGRALHEPFCECAQ